MTLPCTGPIAAGQIRDEFKGPTPWTIGDYRTGGARIPKGVGAIPASGPINFSMFRCLSNTTSGTWERTVAAEYDFVVPVYRELVVTMSGGSGGSGASGWDREREPEPDDTGPGAHGTRAYESIFLNVIAGGGDLGMGQVGNVRWVGIPMPKGYPGNASGGDENVLGGGQKGGIPVVLNSAAGGKIPNIAGGEGGDAGYAKKTFKAGEPGSPVPGETIKVTVGAKGLGGPSIYFGKNGRSSPGTDGVDGYVKIKWS